jgi:hypothetical protein
MIVETPDLSSVDTLAWSVDSVPEFVIGVTDGEAPYLFSSIVGVVRLTDHRIVVADALTDELRFFDPNGRFLHLTGGRGGGPTEFQGLVLLERFAGDSLVAVDREGSRLTVLTPSGEPVRRFRSGIRDNTTGQSAGGMILHVFADGTLLINESLGAQVTGPGIMEHTSRLARVDQNQQRLATYAASDYTLQFVQQQLAGGTRPPARVPPMWVAGSERLYFTPDPTGLYFRRHAPDGTIDRIFRVPGYMYEARLADGETPSDVWALTPDASGHLWVRIGPRMTQQARWIVFDESGEPRYGLRLFDVENRLPFGPTIEIGEDYLLAASRNADDVPIVVLHRLRKRVG